VARPRWVRRVFCSSAIGTAVFRDPRSSSDIGRGRGWGFSAVSVGSQCSSGMAYHVSNTGRGDALAGRDAPPKATGIHGKKPLEAVFSRGQMFVRGAAIGSRGPSAGAVWAGSAWDIPYVVRARWFVKPLFGVGKGADAGGSGSRRGALQAAGAWPAELAAVVVEGGWRYGLLANPDLPAP